MSEEIDGLLDGLELVVGLLKGESKVEERLDEILSDLVIRDILEIVDNELKEREEQILVVVRLEGFREREQTLGG